jgi:hypothetical protein
MLVNSKLYTALDKASCNRVIRGGHFPVICKQMELTREEAVDKGQSDRSGVLHEPPPPHGSERTSSIYLR